MTCILSSEREQDGYDCITRHSSLNGNGKCVLFDVHIIP